MLLYQLEMFVKKELLIILITNTQKHAFKKVKSGHSFVGVVNGPLKNTGLAKFL